jgi:hypothetical protein
MKYLSMMCLLVLMVGCGGKSGGGNSPIPQTENLKPSAEPLLPEINSYRSYDENNIDQESARKDVVRIHLSPDANRRILGDEVAQMYFRADQSYLGLSKLHHVMEIYSKKVDKTFTEEDFKKLNGKSDVLSEMSQEDPNIDRLYFDKINWAPQYDNHLLKNKIYYLKTSLESEKQLGEVELMFWVQCLESLQICHQYKVHFIVKKYNLTEKK